MTSRHLLSKLLIPIGCWRQSCFSLSIISIFGNYSTLLVRENFETKNSLGAFPIVFTLNCWRRRLIVCIWVPWNQNIYEDNMVKDFAIKRCNQRKQILCNIVL
jgi:hypothetical protein